MSSAHWSPVRGGIQKHRGVSQRGVEEKPAGAGRLDRSNSALAVVARRERSVKEEGYSWVCPISAASAGLWGAGGGGGGLGAVGRNPSWARLRCGDLLPSSSRARPGCSYGVVWGFVVSPPLCGWLRVPAEHGWSQFKVKDIVLPS